MIGTADGSIGLDGALGLDQIKRLDGSDFNLLRIGAQMAKATFRLKRAEILRERSGNGSTDHDEGNRNVGAGDPAVTDATHGDISKGTEGDGI